MKKYFLVLVLVNAFLLTGCQKEPQTTYYVNDIGKINASTHYANKNTELLTEDNKLITILPQNTGVSIISKNDGLVKIQSQTGFVGYVNTEDITKIEDNLADLLATDFSKYEAGSFPGKNQHSRMIFDYKHKDVDANQNFTKYNGYYIQQEPRRFQGSGCTPEILEFEATKTKVMLREIDFINGKKVVKNEIKLANTGETFALANTKIYIDNDELLIFYFKNETEDYRVGQWEYDLAYSYAGNLNEPVNDAVISRTTDYLKTFVGEYKVKSYKVLIDYNITEEISMTDTINVYYDEENKCLKFSDKSEDGFKFIETTSDKPFFWIFGEGVGFFEVRNFFYKGGIARTFESTGVRNMMEEDQESYHSKYTIFFEKVR